MKIYIKFLRSFRRVLEHCFHSFYVDFRDNLAFSFRKVSNINKSVLKFFFIFEGFCICVWFQRWHRHILWDKQPLRLNEENQFWVFFSRFIILLLYIFSSYLFVPAIFYNGRTDFNGSHWEIVDDIRSNFLYII